MPIVTVQLTREGTKPGVDHITPKQKAAIYKGMSQTMCSESNLIGAG